MKASLLSRSLWAPWLRVEAGMLGTARGSRVQAIRARVTSSQTCRLMNESGFLLSDLEDFSPDTQHAGTLALLAAQVLEIVSAIPETDLDTLTHRQRILAFYHAALPTNGDWSSWDLAGAIAACTAWREHEASKGAAPAQAAPLPV